MGHRPLVGVTTSEVRRAERTQPQQALNVARGGTLHQHLPAIPVHPRLFEALVAAAQGERLDLAA